MNTIKNIGTFIKNNLISIALLIVALSVAYHYIVYIPQRDKENARREIVLKAYQQANIREAENERVKNIEACQRNAFEVYSESWDGQCKMLGRAKDCGLPQTMSTRLGDSLQEDKTNCIKIY